MPAGLVIDADRRCLFSGTFVGSHVGELLRAATEAILGEEAIDALGHDVFALPTVSAVWLSEADRGLCRWFCRGRAGL